MSIQGSTHHPLVNLRTVHHLRPLPNLIAGELCPRNRDERMPLILPVVQVVRRVAL
jgi:hypothetical protein